MLAVAVKLVSAGLNASCTVGITVSGLSSDLDGDYIATSFALGGAVTFSVETKRRHLSRGCILCKEAMMSSWVIWEAKENETYSVLARCTSGCPESGQFWPIGQYGASRWRLAQDGADVPGAKDIQVSAACCTRLPQPCDRCSNDHCKTQHTTFAGCLAASITTDRCCQPWGWIDRGQCACKAEPDLCDHRAGPAEMPGLSQQVGASLVV